MAPLATAVPPAHPQAPQQMPPPQAQPRAARAQPSAAQAGSFNWPERMEQPQARPIESEMYVYVHGIRYQKLDLAGKGGSSKVYKVGARTVTRGLGGPVLSASEKRYKWLKSVTIMFITVECLLQRCCFAGVRHRCLA